MQGLCCFWRLELTKSFRIAATKPTTPFQSADHTLLSRFDPLQFHISPTLTGSCTYL
jgi:hypothetical protein